jgi:diphthamide synthase (EF-2-diphthine--ammonia ligase)
VRRYREQSLSRVDMQAVFPLWQKDTAALARTFLQTGFKAIITCVDLKALSPAFAGRDYDLAFLADLPAGVDPCGERGEFHSFVYAGPLFRRPVPFTTGRTVKRDNRFLYLDLIPNGAAGTAGQDGPLTTAGPL